MAYFGSIFFANMGGGGGQNYLDTTRAKLGRTAQVFVTQGGTHRYFSKFSSSRTSQPRGATKFKRSWKRVKIVEKLSILTRFRFGFGLLDFWTARAERPQELRPGLPATRVQILEIAQSGSERVQKVFWPPGEMVSRESLAPVQPFFAPVQPPPAPVQQAFGPHAPKHLLHPLLTTLCTFEVADRCSRHSGSQPKNPFRTLFLPLWARRAQMTPCSRATESQHHWGRNYYIINSKPIL